MKTDIEIAQTNEAHQIWHITQVAQELHIPLDD